MFTCLHDLNVVTCTTIKHFLKPCLHKFYNSFVIFIQGIRDQKMIQQLQHDQEITLQEVSLPHPHLLHWAGLPHPHLLHWAGLPHPPLFAHGGVYPTHLDNSGWVDPTLWFCTGGDVPHLTNLHWAGIFQSTRLKWFDASRVLPVVTLDTQTLVLWLVWLWGALCHLKEVTCSLVMWHKKK